MTFFALSLYNFLRFHDLFYCSSKKKYQLKFSYMPERKIDNKGVSTLLQEVALLLELMDH